MRDAPSNLCTDHDGGDTGSVVLVVANMDSSVLGPGINEKGTGAAATLQLALGLQAMGLETVNQYASRTLRGTQRAQASQT